MNKTIQFIAASAIASLAGTLALSVMTSPTIAAGTNDDGSRKVKPFNVELYVEGSVCGGATFTYDPTTALFGVVHTGCVNQSNPIPGIGIVVKENWKLRRSMAKDPNASCTGVKELMFEETRAGGEGSPEGNTYFLNYPLQNGSCWWEYSTTNGVALKPVVSGTYNLVK